MTWRGAALLLLVLAPAARASAGHLRNVEVGQPAPAFPALAKSAGRPVLILYLREGQPLSVKALEAATRLHARHKGAVDFVLLKKGQEPIAAPFPVVFDEGERVYGSYGLTVLPTTIVLDKAHRVADVYPAFSREMEDYVEDALRRARGLKVAEEKEPSAAVASRETGLARKLLEHGRHAEALAEADKALKAGDKTPEARLARGEALLRLSRTDEAAKELEAAGPAGRLLLAETRLKQGRGAEAEALLRQALAAGPSARARYLLGRVHEDAGRVKEAAAEYRAATELLLPK